YENEIDKPVKLWSDLQNANVITFADEITIQFCSGITERFKITDDDGIISLDYDLEEHDDWEHEQEYRDREIQSLNNY
ncbi:MAG: hypothetical protein KKD48_02615, partial [Nanoarchaeota archaeon]|nr:hypothetical protein [Nanoarchaeota archaeon]